MPSFKNVLATGDRLSFEVWSFCGAWALVLGALFGRQLQRDLLFDLVRQRQIGAATLGSRLYDYLRHLGIKRLDSHPDIALIDPTLDGFHHVGLGVHDAFFHERSI